MSASGRCRNHPDRDTVDFLPLNNDLVPVCFECSMAAMPSFEQLALSNGDPFVPAAETPEPAPQPKRRTRRITRRASTRTRRTKPRTPKGRKAVMTTEQTPNDLVASVRKVITDLKKKPSQVATMKETGTRGMMALHVLVRDLSAELENAVQEAESDPVKRLEYAARVDETSRRLIARGQRWGSKIAGEMVTAEEIGRRLLAGDVSFSTAHTALCTLVELPKREGVGRW